MSLSKIILIILVSAVSSLVLTKVYWDNYLKDTLVQGTPVAVLDIQGFVDRNHKKMTNEGIAEAISIKVKELEEQGYIVIRRSYVMNDVALQEVR